MTTEGKIPDTAGESSTGKRPGQTRAHDPRARFYGILLLFIVVVGLPLMSIPSLRHRLTARVLALQKAIVGDTGPVMAGMDTEQSPYPEEYKRTDSKFPDIGQPALEDWIAAEQKKNRSGIPDPDGRALITPQTVDTGAEPDVSDSKSESDRSKPSGPDSVIRYTQGESEQEAYTLLLESYPNVAAIVQGGDSSLQFRSWGANQRSEGVYWVRLTFENDDGLEVEYIWQVNLQARQVEPLNHYARSIS